MFTLNSYLNKNIKRKLFICLASLSGIKVILNLKRSIKPSLLSSKYSYFIKGGYRNNSSSGFALGLIVSSE